MRIGLIPLDERPVNTRLPALLAAGAGATLVQPPFHLLSQRNRPGNSAALTDWLDSVAATLDGVIISCEQLGYGGMMTARTGHTAAATVIERLTALRSLRSRYPQLTVYGFSHMMRIQAGHDLLEEPAYWLAYGAEIRHYSWLIDAEYSGRASTDDLRDLAALNAVLPLPIRRDVQLRRHHNHLITRTLVQMLTDRVFDVLAISVDDTGDETCGHSQPAAWAAQYSGDPRLLIYPAGDELSGVLLARLLLSRHLRTIRLTVSGVLPANHAHGQRVARQLQQYRQALNLLPAEVDTAADIWLGIADDPPDAPACPQQLIPALQQARARGQRVALAITGSGDAALIRALNEQIDLRDLSGLCAWGSGGGPIGCALAQTVCSLIGGVQHHDAQQQLLLYRLLEDYGYQTLLHDELRRWLHRQYQSDEPTNGTALAHYCMRAEQALHPLIDELNGFAQRYELVSASLQLPWRRTHEIDFELRPISRNQ